MLFLLDPTETRQVQQNKEVCPTPPTPQVCKCQMQLYQMYSIYTKYTIYLQSPHKFMFSWLGIVLISLFLYNIQKC